MKNRYAKMSLVILFLIIIDQIAKAVIVRENSGDMEETVFVQNFGGAFGIGGNSTLFFILVTLVVLGIIIKFIYSQKDRVDRKTLLSFTLILAGGTSNLIDRIFRGYVVDYIDLTKYFNFPVFNIADIYIVGGWVLLLISILIYWYKEVRLPRS